MGMFALAGLAAAQAAQGGAANQGTISRATMGPSHVRQQLRYLEANLAKSLMINEALWEIVRDKLHVTQDELNDKLYEIDMRDGEIDGKNQRSVTKCPQCNRPVSGRHPACLYCGQVIDDSVFRLGT